MYTSFAVPYDLERTQVLPWAFLIGQSHVFRRQAHAMHIHIHMPRMQMRRKLIFSFQSDDTRAKLSASLGPRPLEGLSGGSARRPTGQCTTWITGVQRGRISRRPGPYPKLKATPRSGAPQNFIGPKSTPERPPATTTHEDGPTSVTYARTIMSTRINPTEKSRRSLETH